MRSPVLVAVGLVVVVVAGCAPIVERARSAPVAAPAFASEEEALEAAIEAYANLLAVGDAIGQAGGEGVEKLDQFATGSFLQASREGFEEFRSAGWRQVGSTQSRDMEIQQIAAGQQEVLVVYVCDDISGVDVLDPLGNSVVTEGRPNTSYFQVTFDRGNQGLLVSGRIRWDDRKC